MRGFLVKTVFAMLLVTLSGCQSRPSLRKLPILAPATAPIMPLQRVFLASHTSTSLRVEFEDQRPGPERYYYPGLSEPHHWRDAVSMVPMEAFDPAIEDFIRGRFDSGGVVPQRDIQEIRIQLTSFQVVYDQRKDTEGVFLARHSNWQAGKDREDIERQERDDQRRAEAEEERRKKRDDAIRYGDGNSYSESLSGSLLAPVVGAIAQGLFIELPRWAMRREKTYILTEPTEQQTPTFITDGKVEGLNFQISATITTLDSDGRKSRFPVEVVQHRSVDGGKLLQPQVTQLVEESMKEFCDRIAE